MDHTVWQVTRQLQVYRDYKATNDVQYLKDMWPIAKVPSSFVQDFFVL